MREIGAYVRTAHTFHSYAFKCTTRELIACHCHTKQKKTKYLVSVHVCVALNFYRSSFYHSKFYYRHIPIFFGFLFLFHFFFCLKIYIFTIHHKMNVVEETAKHFSCELECLLLCLTTKGKHITTVKKRNNNNKTMSDGILFTIHTQSEQRTHDSLVDFKQKIKSI